MFKFTSAIAFLIVSLLNLSSGAYENNPFLAPQNIVVPQDGQIPTYPLNSQTPSPPAPGYVWVQIPLTKPETSQVPGIQQPTTYHPSRETVTQKPSDYSPTTEGLITIEPPEVLFGGPLNDKCLKPTGQFPSSACNKYVNCWNGIATEQSCIDGLLFNPKGYCDYPSNVNCYDRPSQGTSTPVDVTVSTPSYVTPTVSPIVAPVDPELSKLCLKPRGQFPSKSCNKYINCWDNVAIEQECPEGLLFSVKGYCDYPANVNCENRTPPRNIETSTASQECPLEYGTFRQPNNCTTYFTCMGFKIVARHNCPEGFLFNDNIGVCDYAYRVDCSKDPILTRSGQASYVSNVNPGIQCLQEYGTFRDSTNCSKYYTCLAKQVVAAYECPAGFSFNDNLGVCDYSENVDCSKQPAVYMNPHNFIPVIPPEFKDKIDGCKPGVVFRLNKDCSLACLCREGLAEFIQCPEGLSYDSGTDKCLSPSLAHCENVNP